MTVPIRTCVGCRRRAPATELVRLVLGDGRPIVAGRHRPPGRGAWVHATASCVAAAAGSGALARAFRVRVAPLDPRELGALVGAAASTASQGAGRSP